MIGAGGADQTHGNRQTQPDESSRWGELLERQRLDKAQHLQSKPDTSIHDVLEIHSSYN